MWIHIIIPIVSVKIVMRFWEREGEKKRGRGVFRNGGFKRKMAAARVLLVTRL